MDQHEFVPGFEYLQTGDDKLHGAEMEPIGVVKGLDLRRRSIKEQMHSTVEIDRKVAELKAVQEEIRKLESDLRDVSDGWTDRDQQRMKNLVDALRNEKANQKVLEDEVHRLRTDLSKTLQLKEKGLDAHMNYLEMFDQYKPWHPADRPARFDL